VIGKPKDLTTKDTEEHSENSEPYAIWAAQSQKHSWDALGCELVSALES